MKPQGTRVLLASEHLETRRFLRKLVEIEDRAVVVGEAEDSAEALNMARTLRPDVALIDSYLPSTLGYDGIPLSPLGGSDAAEWISEKVSNTHVVLLSRLSDSVEADSSWRPDSSAFLCREGTEACVPFKVSELGQQDNSPRSVVFANVQTRTGDDIPSKDGLGDKMIFYGALVIVAGWLTILTVAFANVGMFIVFAGAASTILGLAAKLISRRIQKPERSERPARISRKRARQHNDWLLSLPET